jgi:glycosyltransferase involved in cell wall biosynthesis
MTDAPGAGWEQDQQRLAEERRARIVRDRVADSTELAEARASQLARRVADLEAELRRLASHSGPAARQVLEDRLRTAETEARRAKADAAKTAAELRRIRSSRGWKALRVLAGVKRSRGRPRAILRAVRKSRSAPASAPKAPARKPRGGGRAEVGADEHLGPRVSVVMLVARVDDAVAAAIDSVVAQTLAGVELILCGDAVSTDGAALTDRVRDLEAVTLHAGSLAEARRTAAGRYRCELRVPMRLHPTYLEKAVAVLDANPKVDAVTAWVRTVDGELWRPGAGQPAAPPAAPACAVLRPGLDGPPSAQRVIAEPLVAELVAHSGTSPAAVEPASTSMPRRKRLVRTSESRPVVVTLPWFTLGGGDRVVEALLRHWREQERQVVAVTTLDLGKGMVDRFSELLELTPFAYHLPRLLPEKAWTPFVADLVRSLDDPAMLNVGSPWAYRAMPKLRAQFPDLRIVDQQFNNSVHLPSNSSARDSIDLTVAAYPGLVELICVDGRAAESVEVLPVGIPALQMPSDSEIDALRAELGIPAGNRVISFIGRLSSEKRPDWVLALASDLAGQDGLTVVILGDGPLADTLRPGFEAVPGLVWRRALDRVGPLMAGSDVVVLPSETEGIPLVAMEAIQMGVPVVATRVGGMPTLEHDPLVDLCDPADYPEFVATVQAVLARARTPRQARPDAFSLREMLEQYDTVLDEKRG